jgi:5'-nucleotidase
MHILITNDDGVTEPGLLALANAMKEIGKVSILGPNRNWSGGGHVKTLHRPLRVHEVVLSDGTAAFASDGAPSDCVALALLGFIEEPVDLVVSGINPHGNMGHDVTYSGTVTAAMEAVICGTPGIAFSLTGNSGHSAFYFNTAAAVAQRVVETTIEQGLVPDLLLNVNVPNLPSAELRGIRVTRQGMRVYNDALDRRLDPRGKPYYWIGGSSPSGIPDEGTDIGATAEGFVSVTPLHLDLTEFRRTQQMAQWNWGEVKAVKSNGLQHYPAPN